MASIFSLLFQVLGAIMPRMGKRQYYFDLYRELKENPLFVRSVQEVGAKIAEAEAKGRKEEVNKQMMKLLNLCDYNTGLLIPYFFPDFSEGKPMTLNSRPYAFSLMGSALMGSTTIMASRQIGKCVTGETQVRIRKKDGACSQTSMKGLFTQAKASSMEKKTPRTSRK